MLKAGPQLEANPKGTSTAVLQIEVGFKILQLLDHYKLKSTT